MKWANAWAWIGVLVLPFLILFFWWLIRQKKARINAMIAQSLWSKRSADAWYHNEILYVVAMSLCVLFSIVALARPQWGEQAQTLKRQGLDILIAVDVSKSMLTTDVRPSRLERSKWAMKDLVKKLKGDRIGLMAFAGEAFVMCPLTWDYSGFLLTVDDLSPDVISRGGTNLQKAIKQALTHFGSSVGNHQLLVIVTDGDVLEGDTMAAVNEAKNKGVKIFTVGVGTKEGDLIQIQDDKGNKEFLKDEGGRVVKSRLNESLLQEMAYETRGAYVRSTASQFGLDFLYDQQLSLIPKQEHEEKSRTAMIDRYMLFLIPALLSCLWGLWIWQKPVRLFLFICFCCFSSSVWADKAQDLVKQANEELQKGNYDKAIDGYEKAAQTRDVAEIDFNLGTAFVHIEDWDKAKGAFSRVLEKTKSKKIKASANYNWGTGLVRGAEQFIKKQQDQKAKEMLNQAIDRLQSARSFDPEDAQINQNLDYAKRLLKSLEEREKNKKNSDNNNAQEQQQQSSKQGNDQENQSSSNQGDASKTDQVKDQSKKEDLTKDKGLNPFKKHESEKSQKSVHTDEKDKKSAETKNNESTMNQETASQNTEDQAKNTTGDVKEQKQDQAKKAMAKEGAADKKNEGVKGKEEEKKNKTTQANHDDKNKENAKNQGEGLYQEENAQQSEAMEFLEEYNQQDEAKGLLYLINQVQDDTHVSKDW